MLLTESKLRKIIVEEYESLLKEWETAEVIKRSRDGIYYVYEVDDEGNSTKMGSASRDDFERLGYRIPADFDEATNYAPPKQKSYGYKRRWR